MKAIELLDEVQDGNADLFQRFNFLRAARWSGERLFEPLTTLGVTFDYALPQTLLDKAADFAAAIGFFDDMGFDPFDRDAVYNVMSSTTVFIYLDDVNGSMFSLCREVDNFLRTHDRFSLFYYVLRHRAMRGSIEHWTRHAEGRARVGEGTAGEDCDLCRVYTGADCTGCPVKQHTGYPICGNTPWKEARNAFQNAFVRKLNSEGMYLYCTRYPTDDAVQEFRAAAMNELIFLKEVQEKME